MVDQEAKNFVEGTRSVVVATHEYLPFRGGVAVYVHEVAKAARTLGFNPEIWTADRCEARGDKSSATDIKSSADLPVVRFASRGRLTPC